MHSTRLAEVLRADLLENKPTGTATASITDVRHLCSYNWVEVPKHIIAVLGSPALWTPPKTPLKIAKDFGLIYSAQNAARHPDSPLESLFRSLHITNPSFSIHSVDLVTDRNNVRKLLSYINPSPSKNGREPFTPFTIKVEVIKDIAIFCRSEAEVSRVIGPNEFIGDLKLVVRYETDGYVGDAPAKEKQMDSDDLISLVNKLSLGSTVDSTPSATSTTSAASAKSKLMIKKEGKVVPIETTLEIKTRTAYKPIDMEEVLPQLWVSQTPNLVRAYHRQGIFGVPQVEDVTLNIKIWERSHQADLKKLAVLIKKIIRIVK